MFALLSMVSATTRWWMKLSNKKKGLISVYVLVILVMLILVSIKLASL